MPAPFIYATRSVIPSPFANAVQSVNMAAAFANLHESFVSVFRIQSNHRHRLAEIFGEYGLGAPAHLFPLPSHPRFDWSEFYLPAFCRFLRRQPVGATVYTRSGRMAWIATALGLRTTLELHDPLSRAEALILRRMLRRKALPNLVATTEFLKRDIVDEMGIDPNRILVAGGGANAAFLDLPACSIPFSSAFNVGYAGSAYKGKGVEMLLACAERLPAIGFHVIGPTLAECEQHGPVGSNVTLHGRKSHIETIGLLKAMDCLLLGNQRAVILRDGTDIGAHTSPLKMFEYMAAGQAIVASDLPVLRTVLQDGRNALLCSPDAPEDFCREIVRLAQDPDLRNRLAERAVLDFRQKHSWEARAKRVLHFLDSSNRPLP